MINTSCRIINTLFFTWNFTIENKLLLTCLCQIYKFIKGWTISGNEVHGQHCDPNKCISASRCNGMAPCHCCKAQGGNLALGGMHRGVGCTVSFCMSFCMGCTVSFCMGWDAQCRSSTEGWGCTGGKRPCLFCDHAAFSCSAHSVSVTHMTSRRSNFFVLGYLVGWSWTPPRARQTLQLDGTQPSDGLRDGDANETTSCPEAPPKLFSCPCLWAQSQQ